MPTGNPQSQAVSGSVTTLPGSSTTITNSTPNVDPAGNAQVSDLRLLTRVDEALILQLETNGLSETEYIGPLSNREVV